MSHLLSLLMVKKINHILRVWVEELMAVLVLKFLYITDPKEKSPVITATTILFKSIKFIGMSPNNLITSLVYF